MSTYEWLLRFRADFARLTPDQQAAFLMAVRQFVADFKRGGDFRKGLRVKTVQGAVGIFEMTWAPNGRATFAYGAEVTPGETHIIWRRVGTHDIFKRP
jgi:hypothetical protein